jgi:anti-sigma factor RsiW
MSEHLGHERMHDLLDGVGPPDEAERDEAHLEACSPCRTEYERLEALVAELHALPSEARAPEGLWTGVEARIGAASGDAGEVLPFPGAASRRRRLSFTVPQLAAAAVLVALLSAGSVWMALSGRPGPAPMATAPALGEQGAAARMAASGEVAYDAALMELEDLVARNRDRMAPETRDALDRSLATIDAAMEDIRRALAQDPNSELLARLLINQQRSKLRVLGQAATAVQARS